MTNYTHSLLSSDWDWDWGWDRGWEWNVENGNRKVPPVPGDDSIILVATHHHHPPTTFNYEGVL